MNLEKFGKKDKRKIFLNKKDNVPSSATKTVVLEEIKEKINQLPDGVVLVVRL